MEISTEGTASASILIGPKTGGANGTFSYDITVLGGSVQLSITSPVGTKNLASEVLPGTGRAGKRR